VWGKWDKSMYRSTCNCPACEEERREANEALRARIKAEEWVPPVADKRCDVCSGLFTFLRPNSMVTDETLGVCDGCDAALNAKVEVPPSLPWGETIKAVLLCAVATAYALWAY
jgi:hypothetical protein